jgi:hypothetical protein
MCGACQGVWDTFNPADPGVVTDLVENRASEPKAARSWFVAGVEKAPGVTPAFLFANIFFGL